MPNGPHEIWIIHSTSRVFYEVFMLLKYTATHLLQLFTDGGIAYLIDLHSIRFNSITSNFVFSAPMPAEYKFNKKMQYKPKGVAARNEGMLWLKKNKKKGVFYFMDDDNSYDLRLFPEVI